MCFVNRFSFEIVLPSKKFVEKMDERELGKFIDECMKIFDDNVNILSDIEFEINQKNEDNIEPNMNLHNLLDMTEDVAESIKIKKAESNFMRRNID